MNKRIYTILLCLFAVIFLVSAGILGKYYYDAYQQEKAYEDLAQLRQDAPTAARPQLPEETTGQNAAPEKDPLVEITHPETGEKVIVLEEFAKLYQKNPDLIGWIKIPGAGVDYPVMQKPEKKDYYLTRDFNKKSSARGCIYVQEEADVFSPSDNITIYGHRMKDGSMFGKLDKYLKESFCKKNPYIYFDTLTQLHTYEIIAVFTTTASKGEGFAYHNFIDAADEAAFDEFVSQCKDLAIYDTGVTAQYGDKLITLSTCEYTQTNGRLVIVAKRVA